MKKKRKVVVVVAAVVVVVAAAKVRIVKENTTTTTRTTRKISRNSKTVEGKTRVRFVVVVARISPKSRTGFRRPSFLKVVGRFHPRARASMLQVFSIHIRLKMYLSKCIIERSRVSAYFPWALSFFLLQRRDTNNELSFCFTSSFPLPIATESFPSNLSRSECLSKPLRSVRFEPYFPSSVSPRRLESRP